MLDSTRRAQVSRECQTFAKDIKDYPTILFEPSTDFFGLIILGREKTKSLDLRQLVACLPCQVILDKVTNQQWCLKTPIPGYKNKAIQWKGCEQESSSSWYRVGIRCLVNQIWTDQSDYQILREKRILCNSQQCTWFHVNLGIQVFSGQYSEFHLISIFYLEWWSYYHPFCLPVVALLRGHYQPKRCTLP